MADRSGLQTAARMGGYGLLTKALLQLVGVLRLVVLARLIAPEYFGVFGVALLAVTALRAFSEPGFQAALIQQKQNPAPYLDTVFTVYVFRGLVLGGAVYLAAPLVATFFEVPESMWVLRSVAILLVLEGVTSPAMVYLNRDLAFSKIYLIDVLDAGFALVAAIVFGVLLGNVWALILSILLGQLVRTVASYWAAPYRPKLTFDGSKLREIARFGGAVMGSRILVYVLVNLDDVLVGKLIGPVGLGLYQVAYRIGNLPATDLARVVSQVGFPALSQVQDDQASLRERAGWTLYVSALLALPASAGLLVLAPDLIPAALGPDWVPAVPVLQVLCVFGAIRALNASFGSLLWAIGRPGYVTRVSAVQLAVVAALAVPAIQEAGLVGIAGVIALGNALALGLLAHRAIGMGTLDFPTTVSAVGPGLLLAGAAALVTVVVQQVLPGGWTHLGRLLMLAVPLLPIVAIIFGRVRRALRDPHLAAPRSA